MQYGIQSIHQTGWQGTVELSDQPRTNYIPYSHDLGSWTAYLGSADPSTTPAPSGDGYYSHLVESSVSGYQMIGTTVSAAASSQEVIVSFSAKSDGSGRLACITGLGLGGANANPTFDLDTGVAVNNDGSGNRVHGVGMHLLGDGGYLCWASILMTTNLTFSIGICNNASGSDVYRTGDGTSGVLVDAVMMEIALDRNYPGAYIPTTTAPVTVTDYTPDEHGGIHVGDADPSGAVLDWSGSGFAGNKAVTAEAVEFGTKDGVEKDFQLVGPDGYAITSIHDGWPSSLPCPFVGGDSQYAPFISNVISSSMSTGAPKRRRRFTSVPETFSTSVLLSDKQVETLQAFVKDTLKDVKPFMWKDFRTGGLASYVFQERPSYSHAQGSRNMWVASLSLRTVP